MKFLLPILLIFTISVSCAKKKAKEQAAEDDAIIQQYISDHNLSATSTESGLYVVIDNPGTGPNCYENSYVKVAYSGYFTDGSVFDGSATGIEFGLQSVIQGWTEGIPHFKEGGNGILLIQSALAYGPEGKRPIPGNTVLIFDIELIEVL